MLIIVLSLNITTNSINYFSLVYGQVGSIQIAIIITIIQNQ